jgi:hypothetical protein
MWETKLSSYSTRYNKMQKGTFSPFALETQGYLHARARLRLCKIARLQAEYADDRRQAAKYPSYEPLGVLAAADRACVCDPAAREPHPHAAVAAGLLFRL